MEKDIATFRASTRRWLFGSFAGWLTLLLMPVGLGVLIFLLTWLKNVGTRYELTDQRLIIKSGILMKRIDEIELYRVKDVTVDFSLLNQMLISARYRCDRATQPPGEGPFAWWAYPGRGNCESNSAHLWTKPAEDAAFANSTLIATSSGEAVTAAPCDQTQGDFPRLHEL